VVQDIDRSPLCFTSFVPNMRLDSDPFTYKPLTCTAQRVESLSPCLDPMTLCTSLVVLVMPLLISWPGWNCQGSSMYNLQVLKRIILVCRSGAGDGMLGGNRIDSSLPKYGAGPSLPENLRKGFDREA
jgi:hypothetical protein